MNPSWFIVLFLIIWSLSDEFRRVFDSDTEAFALAVVSALLFFGSILLHELGHALVSIRRGIEIDGIDLWLFGGVARMRRDSDSARTEFLVAVAGPLVTLAIVVGCALAGVAVAGTEGFGNAITFDSSAGVGPVDAVLGYLTWINAFLLVVNLLPGFPLDGGRIMRSIVWWRTGDRVRATRVAARLGLGFAYLLGAFGVYAVFVLGSSWGILDIVLAWFLGQAARVEEAQSTLASKLQAVSVADVMDAEPVAIPTGARLDQAFDEFFLRYGWPWFPVVDSAGRFAGVLRREQVEQVDPDDRRERTVAELVPGAPDGDLSVRVDDSLAALLRSEGLRRHGALMAVDRDGVLRGVVTLDRVRRALRASLPAS